MEEVLQYPPADTSCCAVSSDQPCLFCFATSYALCWASMPPKSAGVMMRDRGTPKRPQVFTNAIQCLSEEDRGLEPIGHFLPILKRGIAVHHSGLLPLLKELVELLFQEGLIKVRSVGHRSPVTVRRLSQGRRTDMSSTQRNLICSGSDNAFTASQLAVKQHCSFT